MLVFGGAEGGGKADDPKLPVEEEETDEDSGSDGSYESSFVSSDTDSSESEGEWP